MKQSMDLLDTVSTGKKNGDVIPFMIAPIFNFSPILSPHVIEFCFPLLEDGK